MMVYVDPTYQSMLRSYPSRLNSRPCWNVNELAHTDDTSSLVFSSFSRVQLAATGITGVDVDVSWWPVWHSPDFLYVHDGRTVAGHRACSIRH